MYTRRDGHWPSGTIVHFLKENLTEKPFCFAADAQWAPLRDIYKSAEKLLFIKKRRINMSYCVNCGVELTESANSCPLCDTPVINPNILNAKRPDPPFPETIVIPKATKNKFSALILSLIILLPNIICIITNLIFTPTLLWSVYVASTSAMFWFLFIFPVFMKSKRKYLTITVDAIATAAYIFVFYYYNSARTGWFWKLAVPLDIGVFLCVAFLTFYFSKKRTLTKSLITTFGVLAALNVFVCVVVNLYAQVIIVTYLTIILAISGLILMLFFVAVEKNYKLRAWLSRKFFF